MTNLLLYGVVVLIWGSSWIMVKFQLGIVPPEASIAYRMGCAAICLFGWSWLSRATLRFGLQDHLFLALQGMLLFSCNFFLFYLAAQDLTTGLIAMVCSTASMWIMMVNAIILRKFPTLRVLFGALLGVIGISLIFYPELAGMEWSSGAGRGLLLSLGGTLCFSLGSIISARNQRAGFPGLSNVGWSMFYGTLILTLFTATRGHGFNFDLNFPYVASLLYLSLIGSVVAFLAYFALLRRIPAERAAYVTVLFPVVALGLSTLFEGYVWTGEALLGVLLILAGNMLVLMPSRSPI